jgi:MFS family permease
MEQPTKLLNKNFFLLWQGQLVSRLGVNIYGIAMVLYLKDMTQSATLMGIMWMLTGLPMVILGPFAGTFADRYSRRKILILCELINGFVVAAYALYLFKVSATSSVAIIGIYVVAVFLGITGAFYNPAVSASIPDIVPRSKIIGANSLGQISVQVTTFIGQAVGAWLYKLSGAVVVCVINAISYFYAGASKLFITIPQKFPEKKHSLKEQFQDFKTDLVEGFQFVWKNKGLRMIIYVAGITNFFTTPILPLLPFYVVDVLKLGEQWFGVFVGITGIGALFGYAFAAIIKLTPRLRGTLIIIFIILMSIGYGVLGFVRVPSVAIILSFIGGFMNGYIAVNIAVTLQLTTPTEIRGRVMAVLATLIGSLTPIGMGVGGYLGDLLDKNIPLIYGSCSAIMAILTILAAMNKDFRDYLASDQEVRLEPKNAEENIVPDIA